MTAPTDPLADLRNLGEKSAELLREIGIEKPEALSEAGAALAYKILKHRFPKEVTLNFLYAMEGALQNRHWNSFTPEEKEELKAAVEGELETEYLMSIPGMRESLLKAAEEPLDECDEELDWS